jgi:hypothetical protein
VGEIQRGVALACPDTGQQIVIPPSIHPDTGRMYRWRVDPVHAPLPSLPEPWRDYLIDGDTAPRRLSADSAFLAAAMRRPPDDDPHLLAALRQPGAIRRGDKVKFQCPACRAEGGDTHRDNAIYRVESGAWGCAVAPVARGGRTHYDAIRRALGILNDADYIEALWKKNDRAT